MYHIALIDLSAPGLSNFLISFIYTILVVFLITRFIYYRRNGKKEFLFTYLIATAIVYQMCVLLSAVSLEVGLALGLFALFGLLRYRTVSISPKELTYLFLCIGISAKNSLGKSYIPLENMVISDSLLAVIVFVSEYFLFPVNSLLTKIIVYQKTELLQAGMEEALKTDLELRYNLKNIVNIQKGKIDESKGIIRLKLTIDNSDLSNFDDN